MLSEPTSKQKHRPCVKQVKRQIVIDTWRTNDTASHKVSLQQSNPLGRKACTSKRVVNCPIYATITHFTTYKYAYLFTAHLLITPPSEKDSRLYRVVFVCLFVCLFELMLACQATAVVMSGRCLHFMGLLQKLEMS